MELPTVEATFSLTYPERLKANWALTIGHLPTLLLLSVFPLVGIVMLVLMTLPESQRSAMDLVMVAMCLGFVPAMFLLNSYRAHRAASKFGPCRYRFDTQGLLVATSLSELKLSWAAIPRIRERYGILLVYIDRKCAHCAPVRAIGPEGAAAVIRLAEASGVPGAGV